MRRADIVVLILLLAVFAAELTQLIREGQRSSGGQPHRLPLVDLGEDGESFDADYQEEEQEQE